MKDNVLLLQLHQQEKADQHLGHLVEMELGTEQPPATEQFFGSTETMLRRIPKELKLNRMGC